jgi:hypothetical protein
MESAFTENLEITEIKDLGKLHDNNGKVLLISKR